MHLEPCYKQFTLIFAKWKEKLPEKNLQLSGRLSSPARKETLVYPKQCNICKKYKLKVKGKHEFPITISTLNATETIKAAAMQKKSGNAVRNKGFESKK